MPTRAHLALVALLFACAAASCDSLKARHRANQAAALYKDGKLVEAARVYAEAEELDPAIAAIHLNLGFTHLSLFNAAPKTDEGQRHGALAVEEFRQYIERRPKDPRGRQYLIQTFVDTRRYDDAVAFFKPELERAHPSLEAISLLGQIAAKVGRIDDALGWYQKRVDLAPSETEGLDGLGVLIWDYLHNHVGVTGEARLQLADRGIAALKKSIELKPHPHVPYTYVNLLYRERAAGHLCPVGTPDGGAPLAGAGEVPDAGPSCEALKTADTAEADRYLKIALEKIKAAGPSQPSQPSGGPKAPKPPGGTR